MVDYYPGILSYFYSIVLYIILRLLSYGPYASRLYSIGTLRYNAHRSAIRRRRVTCW